MPIEQPTGEFSKAAKVACADQGNESMSFGPSLAGRTIGNYKVLRIIGRGGMGTVYEAQQQNPRRAVALKIISPGMASPSALARFEHEAQILGRLQHLGIAQVFEAGTFDVGAGVQPFFAMELIKGEPLTRYAMRRGLSTRQRLELIVKICHAVAHAHQRGIIHRDLKPGNILVVDEDDLDADFLETMDNVASGQGSRASSNGSMRCIPKVLDFGVARATDGDVQTTTVRTDVGQLVGTVPYMSPEQAGGDPNDIDTRSDVYALGVVTYELLADRLPYDLHEKMIHEAVRVIREDDPTPLSSINRTLRGDVEIIIGTALQKEKERRYQTVLEFASDIDRYLRDEPIVARPPSRTYQMRKFARRNKALVGSVAAAFIALFIGFVAASALYRAEAAAARETEAQLMGIIWDSPVPESTRQKAIEVYAAREAQRGQPYYRQILGMPGGLDGLPGPGFLGLDDDATDDPRRPVSPDPHLPSLAEILRSVPPPDRLRPQGRSASSTESD